MGRGYRDRQRERERRDRDDDRPTPAPQPSPSPAPAPTPTPQPVPSPTPAVRALWISRDEIMALKTSGTAWDRVSKAANGSIGSAQVANQDSNHDVYTLARALVGVRTGNQTMIESARLNIKAAVGTERGGETLAAGRNVVSYVVAASIVGLGGSDEAGFRTWLRNLLNMNLSGRTLVSTHRERPNNWGTHAGASRIAIAAYLGDTSELNAAANVFHGWLGARSIYSSFKYGDLDWQADQRAPVGINKRGTTIKGHDVDGVLPEEMRRAGGFKWPPPKENYAWEALQGAVVQAELLYRAGYDDVWSWESAALLRAFRWLWEVAKFPPEGDDRWITFLINKRLGTSYAVDMLATHGKDMGWTSWTHG